MKTFVQHRRWFTKLQWTTARALPLSVVVVIAMLFVPIMQAQTGYSVKVLHSFTGTNGASPLAYPIRDAEGNFYGTTESGGAVGVGTVFEVDASGKQTMLYSFSGPDGLYPTGALVRDGSGNLYGTTFLGGDPGVCTESGCGEVFKIDASGTLTVLHAFTNTNGDGILAGPGLLQDAAGNLYGTTQNGGSGVCKWSYWKSCGTVFKIDPAGNESVVYSFTGANGDGAEPFTTLVMDSAGSIYGATQFGGDYSGLCGATNRHGCGTIWKLDPNTGQETVLHVFTGSDGDGADPNPGGYLDAKGNFYGTTPHGGNLKACRGFSGLYPGCGVVFRIDTSGNYSVLYRFSGPDGKTPGGPLIQDKEGNFYGTAGGGTYDGGTVFEMSTTDGVNFQLTTLFNFTLDNSEPKSPTGSVLLDAHGNLYGLSAEGGGWGVGSVFKLIPNKK